MPSSFDVIAEPARRRLLDLLLNAPATVGELVAATGMSQPTTSRHLRVLRDAGLVESRTAGQHRRYQLRAEGFADLARWLTPYVMRWQQEQDGLLAAEATGRPRSTRRLGVRFDG